MSWLHEDAFLSLEANHCCIFLFVEPFDGTLAYSIFDVNPDSLKELIVIFSC